MALPTATPPRREPGFGMVEAIIAGMVLLIVGAAISTAVISTMRSQATMSRSERKMSVAEGLFERLKSDNQWAGPSGAGCNSMAINVTRRTCSSAWLNGRYAADAVVDQTDSDKPVRYQVQYAVVGIDDPGDGTGRNDTDGTRPDFFDAQVRVSQLRSDGSADTAPAVVRGTIDPPGRISTGALTINVCQVKRQWDERSPIASCPNDNEVLLGYPAGCIPLLPGCDSDSHAAFDWGAAIDNAGSGGGSTGWKRVTYLVEPANGVQVRLTKKADPGVTNLDVYTDGWVAPTGCSGAGNRRSVTCRVTSGSPLVTVPGLLPGHYAVQVVPGSIPAGYETWPLQSIPSGDTAIVEGGRTSRVLQVIKPRDRAAYTVDLWSCDESTVMTWGSGPCVDRIEPSGFSGYLAPAASARAHWSFDSSQNWFTGSGLESVGAGADTITFNNLPPGLYSGRVVTAGQSSIALTDGFGGGRLPWMWIEPTAGGIGTGDTPRSGRPTYTRHWCDYDRRVAYLASHGLGSDGGIVERTVPDFTRTQQSDGTWIWVQTGSHIVEDHYYSADDYCAHGGGGGGGPPGPGSGGA